MQSCNIYNYTVIYTYIICATEGLYIHSYRLGQYVHTHKFGAVPCIKCMYIHIATKLYDNYDTLMNIIYDRAPGGGGGGTTPADCHICMYACGLIRFSGISCN